MIASALALAVGKRSWEEMNSEMIAALSCLFFQGLIKAEVLGLAGITNVGVNISTDSLKSNQVSSNETVHETSRLRAKSSISETTKPITLSVTSTSATMQSPPTTNIFAIEPALEPAVTIGKVKHIDDFVENATIVDLAIRNVNKEVNHDRGDSASGKTTATTMTVTMAAAAVTTTTTATTTTATTTTVTTTTERTTTTTFTTTKSAGITLQDITKVQTTTGNIIPEEPGKEMNTTSAENNDNDENVYKDVNKGDQFKMFIILGLSIGIISVLLIIAMAWFLSRRY